MLNCIGWLFLFSSTCLAQTFEDLVRAWNVLEPPVVSEEGDVNEYADRCRSVLGPLPKFDCQKGEILPIFYGGKEVSFLNGKIYVGGRQKNTGDLCDNPSLVNHKSCTPYSRIQLQTVGPTNWLLLCRTLKWQEKSNPNYQVVDVIGSNSNTGETCFFDAGFRDGSHVPTPGGEGPWDIKQREHARKFWLRPPGTNACTGCHNHNGPWLFSPHVAHARIFKTGEKDLMPKIPRKKRSTPGSGYRVIDLEGEYEGLKTAKAVFPLGVNGNPDRTCVRCHTITDEGGLFSYSIGEAFVLGQLSPPAEKFPLSRWMPHGHGVKSMSEWTARYGKAVERLKYCRHNVDSTKCLPKKPVFTPCPKPKVFDKKTLRHELQPITHPYYRYKLVLSWKFENDLGGAIKRDDVRFQVDIKASDGNSSHWADVTPQQLGSNQWSFAHPARPGLKFQYAVSAIRYCYDSSPNTQAAPVKYEVRVN